MTRRQRELEYQLEKLHRDKMEQSLEQIRNDFSRYYRTRERQGLRRRRENIYVLFAIGVIGGFVTLTPPELLQIITNFSFGVTVFALASFVFLIVKLNTVTFLGIRPSKGIAETIDKVAGYLFAFSINGSILLIASAFVISTIGVTQTDELTQNLTYLLMIVATVMTFLFRFVSIQRVDELDESREEFHKEVVEELNEDTIDSLVSLKNTSDGEKRLRLYSTIIHNLRGIESEFKNIDEFEPIEEEFKNLDGVPDDMAAVLTERFEETRNELEKRSPSDELSLEEQREELRAEYEKLLAGEKPGWN